MHLVVVQAVATGLAESAEEPRLGYAALLVARSLRLLVLLAIYLDFPREVLLRLFIICLALVGVVEVDILEVRGPRHRRVVPLFVGMRELVVEDGDGSSMLLPWKGVSRPAAVVVEALLDHLQGHLICAVQLDHVAIDLRDGVLVVHVEDILPSLEPRSAHERLSLLVELLLLQQVCHDVFAAPLAGGASVCDVVGRPELHRRLAVLLVVGSQRV